MFVFCLNLIFLLFISSKALPVATSFSKGNDQHELFHLRKDLSKHVSDFTNFTSLVHERNRPYLSEHQFETGEKLSKKCHACVFLVNLAQRHFGNNQSSQEIKGALGWIEKGCEYFDIEAPRVCRGAHSVFHDEVAEVFSKIQLPAEEICGLSLPNVCSNFHNVASSFRWTVEVPPKPEKIYKSSFDQQDDSPRLKVLHLSDVHIDMKYFVGGMTNCGKPLCCRKPSDVAKSESFLDKIKNALKLHFTEADDIYTSKDKAMKWGDYRDCDLPWWTFDDLMKKLSNLNRQSSKQIDYILFTGDLPAHDIWAQTKQQQIDMIYNVANAFMKYFPNTPIFSAIGNHDSFPANSFPPRDLQLKAKYRTDWVYSSYAEAWKKWLPAEAIKTMMKGGYYTVLIKPGFRIVSLNTNLCYTENFWLWLDKNDPEGMLTWFVNVLKQAEARGEKVQVIGHVPPGRDPECMKTWSKNYFRIIERFQNTIAAQFFGHTHYDEIELFYDSVGKPISVAYIAPSVTSYVKMKPSYRMYDVDGYNVNSTWSVLNHQTYTMNFIQANSTDNPVWRLEYDACNAYNLTSLTPENWSKIVRKWFEYLNGNLPQIPESLLLYLKFYFKRHPLLDHEQQNNLNFMKNIHVKDIVCDVSKNVQFEPCSFE